jgi:nucleoid DNA-binding protein
MTLTYINLVKRLVEESGLSEKEVTDQLTDLIARIEEKTYKNEAYSISKFGKFTNVEGRLVFEPDKTLSLEVNHKYAGMEPIEVVAAYKDGEDEEIEEEVKTAGNKQSASQKDDSDRKAKEAKTGSDEKSAIFSPELRERKAGNKENSEAVKPTPDTNKKEVTKEAPLKVTGSYKKTVPDKIADQKEKKQIQKAGTEPKAVKNLKPEQEKEKQKQKTISIPKKTTRAAVSNKTYSPSRKEKSVNGTAAIVTGVFGVAIVVSLVWFLVRQNAANSTTVLLSDNAVNSQVATNSQSRKVTAKASLSKNVNADTTVSKNKNGQKTISAGVTARKSKMYGLKGELSLNNSDFYTVVVYSLTEHNRALQVKNRIDKERNYRVSLSGTMVNGKQVWRIGLGQFKNIKDAKQAAGKLPSKYRENHFIKHVHLK